MSVGDISPLGAARGARTRTRNLKSAAAAAAAALTAAVLPAPRAEAQTVYYTHPGGGDWFTGFDLYFGWRFDASGGFAFTDLPPAGGTARIAQFGTNGIAGGTVLLNFAYTATNALGNLVIDSGNAVNQASGTSALVVTMGETIGNVGTGRYTQTAGVHRIGGDFFIVGSADPSGGTYTLNGGTLSIGGTTQTRIGEFGSGTVVQNGGTATTGNVYVGFGSIGSTQAHGLYELNAGLLTVNGDLTAGDFGFGEFFQAGGQATVNGNLALGTNVNGTNAASFGIYDMGGGTLHVTGDADFGVAGGGEFFNFSPGGTAVFDGTVTIARSAGASGLMELIAGSATAKNVVLNHPNFSRTPQSTIKVAVCRGTRFKVGPTPIRRLLTVALRATCGEPAQRSVRCLADTLPANRSPATILVEQGVSA